MGKQFTVTVPRDYTFEEGWGVHIISIWAGDDEPERIVEIEVSVVAITEAGVRIVGGAPCVQVEDNLYCPIENFQREVSETYDDTHDLRSRWFATEDEARVHARYTRSRWENPAVWESFVQV